MEPEGVEHPSIGYGWRVRALNEDPMKQRLVLVVWVWIVASGGMTAWAQWTTQTIPLRSGWNAIYLEVQPQPEECDQIFAGLPVESVWAWNRRFSTVQFIQDVNELVAGQPDWLVYLPPGHAGRDARNLFTLQGGRAYLVKLANGAGPVSWTIKGQPVIPVTDWLANSLNFVGFPLAPGGSPTFQTFFAGSPAHSGQPVYRLNAAGVWERLTSPAASSLRSGEAYWIYSSGPSTFSGSLDVVSEQRDGLIYGRLVNEQTVRIKNRSAAPTTVTLKSTASQAPPAMTFPWLAGEVPLSYFRINAAANEFGWSPLAGTLARTNLAPGGEWVLRLEVNRTQMAVVTPPPNNQGVLYQSVLEISEPGGSRYQLGVSAEGIPTYAPAATRSFQGSAQPNAVLEPDPRAGLWVGSVSVDHVNQPAAISDPDTPTPTAAPFQFRIILHVDDSGQVRLLQKVLQMFKTGTLKPSPDDPAVQIVDQPGRYVLVTDDALIPRFSGSTLRDGQLVARRFSSPAFGFSSPIPMSGVGAFGAGTFTGQVVINYDDPLNPFKHAFHPDHDNLDERFEQKFPEGLESFSITRRIELEFTTEDPDHLAIAGWGDNQLGGIYRETVIGLHAKTIHASGTFRLVQASQIGVLNDGL